MPPQLRVLNVGARLRPEVLIRHLLDFVARLIRETQRQIGCGNIESLFISSERDIPQFVREQIKHSRWQPTETIK
jgi:hypothetical protein